MSLVNCLGLRPANNYCTVVVGTDVRKAQGKLRTVEHERLALVGGVDYFSVSCLSQEHASETRGFSVFGEM